MVEKFDRFRFTQPHRQFLMMAIVFGLFAGLVFVLLPRVIPVFLNSPYLNGLILVVFAIGIIACFWQVAQLSASVRWINQYQISNENTDGKRIKTPRLLAPLAVLMKGNQLPSGMSTASAQSILDSIASRMDEARDITRYLINLLIFLGLLGTFYGLATTIPAVVETIQSLRMDEAADSNTRLTGLMSGLEGQLGGMGTAFGSSLIGLTGSLMVGLLELLAVHGQNRFYREFEEWLSHFTSVGMAERGLELNLDTSEDTPLSRAFRELNGSLLRLDERLASQSDNTTRIEQLFEQMNESLRDSQNMSADMRGALRGVEAQMLRMGEDLNVGRDGSTNEIRRDLIAINQSLHELIRTQV